MTMTSAEPVPMDALASELKAAMVGAESAHPVEPWLILEPRGVLTAGDGRIVRRLCEDHPGVDKVFVSPFRGQLRIHWRRGELDIDALARRLWVRGVVLGVMDEEHPPLPIDAAARVMMLLGWTGFFLSAAAAGFGATIEPGTIGLLGALQIVACGLALIAAGRLFIRSALIALSVRQVHPDLPLVLGLVLGLAGVYLPMLLEPDARAATFGVPWCLAVAILATARWLQLFILEGRRSMFVDLRAAPSAVERPPPSLLHQTRPPMGKQPGPLSLGSLKIGDVFQVHPDGVVPVRSRVLSKVCRLRREFIRDEVDPSISRLNAIAPAGTKNDGSQPCLFEALETWQDSCFRQRLERIWWESPANNRGWASHVSLPLFAGICMVALAWISFLIWNPAPLHEQLLCLAAVCLLASPFGTEMPMACLADRTLVTCRRFGIFPAGARIWRPLALCKRLIFGTGAARPFCRYELARPKDLKDLGEPRQRILMRMVQDDDHPVSRALFHALHEMGIDYEKPPAGGNQPESDAGGGRMLLAGSGTWRLSPKAPLATAAPWPMVETTVDCWEFSVNGQPLAELYFMRAVRDPVLEEIEGLRGEGLSFTFYTGQPSAANLGWADALNLVDTQVISAQEPVALAQFFAESSHENVCALGSQEELAALDAASVSGEPAECLGNGEKTPEDAPVAETPPPEPGFRFYGNGLAAFPLLRRIAQSRHEVSKQIYGLYTGGVGVAVILALFGLVPLALAPLIMLLLAVPCQLLAFSHQLVAKAPEEMPGPIRYD